MVYLFLNPKEKRYVREFAKILDVDPKNLSIKLQELEQEGILLSSQQGQEKYYSLNENFPLLEEYKKIVEKTIGLEYLLKKHLENVPNIKNVYIFGSYAKNKLSAGSDIDLLIVGDQKSLDLQRKIVEIQKKIGREINVVEFTKNEFEEKKSSNDFFIMEIINNPIIQIL